MINKSSSSHSTNRCCQCDIRSINKMVAGMPCCQDYRICTRLKIAQHLVPNQVSNIQLMYMQNDYTHKMVATGERLTTSIVMVTCTLCKAQLSELVTLMIYDSVGIGNNSQWWNKQDRMGPSLLPGQDGSIPTWSLRVYTSFPSVKTNNLKNQRFLISVLLFGSTPKICTSHPITPKGNVLVLSSSSFKSQRALIAIECKWSSD